MKRFILIPALAFACACGAQMVSIVEITDMYGNEEITLMTPDEFRTLKAEIQAEAAAFPKAMAAVKKGWELEAKESDMKDFPKFVDPKMAPRKYTAKGPYSQKQGEVELDKRKARVEKKLNAMADAKKAQEKAAKGALTSAATDNRADKEKAKADLREAVKGRIAARVEAEMEKILERPVPKVFVVNAAAGMSEAQQKEKEALDAKMKAARENKEKAKEAK